MLDRWLQSPVSDVTIQTTFALATTPRTAAASEPSVLYARPTLTHRPEADRSSSFQYAKPGKTSTAFDPYATTGFQYIIDSYIEPKYGDYIYQGCYTDTFGVLLADRALNNKSANYGVGSIELCGQFCQGFQYFGLENGNECRYFRDIQIF